MNGIDTVKFLFDMQNETFARKLYARWDSFFAVNFERIADEVLTRYDVSGEQIEIRRLELDLGVITEETFDERFPFLLKEKLEEALSICIFGTDYTKNEVKRMSKEESTFSLFRHFLLYGSLPQSAGRECKNIRELFLSVLRTSTKELTAFLRNYGHYTSLQERLVYQLGDPELERGIRFIAPAESTFICSYVRLLTSKYKRLNKPTLTEINHRHAVWKVVYAYVLTDRSSYFNKKTFIADTILKLSARYNTGYTSLLEVLASEQEYFLHILAVPPELFLILNELKKEDGKEEARQTLLNPAKLYQRVSALLKQELETDSGWMTKEILITVLANEDSCRSFIVLLKEEEIIRLVPIVAPSGESDFVIHYARSLDKQKEQGRLQGKAGGEFSKLKWMVIFPLLLERKGTDFNRKHFAIKVLKKVAARYNLETTELLKYFVQEPALFRLNTALHHLLTNLYEETRPTPMIETDTDTHIRLLGKIKNAEKLTGREKERLAYVLGEPMKTLEFIKPLKETELHTLTGYFAPEEKTFVIDYAGALDHQQRRGTLEGKAGGEFKHLKWMFIFNVITERGESGFDRRYFVGGVLKKIAARYNIGYTDLLFYFRSEQNQLRLPKSLDNVLNELFEEEKRYLTSHISLVSREEDKHRLLKEFYSTEKDFVVSLVNLLEQYQRIWTGTKFSKADFSRKKWEFVFSLLFENSGMSFNKKVFTAKLIERISVYYHLKTEEAHVQLHMAIRKDKISVPSELTDIIKQSRSTNETMPVSDEQEESATLKILKLICDQYIVSDEQEESATPLYINNAGIVLLSPYLPRLFSMLELTEAGKFKDRDAQIRAMFLMQYIVFEKTEFPEHEMTLHKILTGFKTGDPIPYELELTEKEKETVEGMMKGVIQLWEKLKNTSMAGLREGFLRREGKLETKDDFYMLTVEEKSYDMLLDTVPWGFKVIKYGWMEKAVQVKWR